MDRRCAREPVQRRGRLKPAAEVGDEGRNARAQADCEIWVLSQLGFAGVGYAGGGRDRSTLADRLEEHHEVSRCELADRLADVPTRITDADQLTRDVRNQREVPGLAGATLVDSCATDQDSQRDAGAKCEHRDQRACAQAVMSCGAAIGWRELRGGHCGVVQAGHSKAEQHRCHQAAPKPKPSDVTVMRTISQRANSEAPNAIASDRTTRTMFQ